MKHDPKKLEEMRIKDCIRKAERRKISRQEKDTTKSQQKEEKKEEKA